MKFFNVLLVFVFISCSTIDTSVFEVYDNNISFNVLSLEETTENIFFLGKELFANEVASEVSEILDTEIIRVSPYETNLSSPPFYNILVEVKDALMKTNSFLRNYSKSLFYIASNDFQTPESISVLNSSLSGITEELEIDNDITEYSIFSLSLITRNISERLSYRQRVRYLQEISQASHETVIQILEENLNLINNLEFIAYDYYSRIFFILENELYNTEDFFKRRELAREILELNNHYEDFIFSLIKLQNDINLLISAEKDIHNIIMNENFDDNTIADFMMINYNFYEEL